MKQSQSLVHLLLRVLVLGTLVFAEVVGAATNSNTTEEKPKPSRKAKPAKQSQLGTSFRFGADSLHGKYQHSASTTATVENDKYLDDLLSAPKNFNGRAELEAQKN
jgi:hypothetical protein